MSWWGNAMVKFFILRNSQDCLGTSFLSTSFYQLCRYKKEFEKRKLTKKKKKKNTQRRKTNSTEILIAIRFDILRQLFYLLYVHL